MITICQLMELRHFIELNLRLKFKGCNHPRRLLNRPQRQNTNPDFRLEPLESSTPDSRSTFGSSLDRSRGAAQGPGTGIGRRTFRDNRSSSMTQLPTIRNSRKNHVRDQSRQRFVLVLYFFG